ncbi:MAG: DUF4870 domain-containing protein [Planctomycetota bacterium]
MWAMLCHITAFSGYLIPLGSILGPLICWLIKKDQYPFVDDQGKESLNFQISVVIYLIVSIALVFVFVGFVLLPIVAIGQIVLTIVGGVKAHAGEHYRYPLTIRMVR